MLTEEIDLGRCVCIHAQLQAVDMFIQQILYQRSVVPSLVQHLITTPENESEEKFASSYHKVGYLNLRFHKRNYI